MVSFPWGGWGADWGSGDDGGVGEGVEGVGGGEEGGEGEGGWCGEEC